MVGGAREAGRQADRKQNSNMHDLKNEKND